MEIVHDSENKNTDKVPQMPIVNDSSSTQSLTQATITTASSTPVNVTKDGKKRIRPNFLRSVSSTNNNISSSSTITTTSIPNNFNQLITNPDIDPPNNEISRESPYIGNNRRKESVPLDSNTNSTSLPNERSILSAAGGKVNGEIHSLSTSNKNNDSVRSSMITPSVVMSQVRLSSHKVKEFLFSKNLSESKKDLKVECHNVKQGLSRIVCSLNKVNIWSDAVPSAVTLIAGNDNYVVIGCENGSVIIYDHSGLRLLSSIVLDSVASHLLISREYLLCLSQTGIVNVWKLPKFESIVSSVSIVPIIQPSSSSLTDFHYASIEKVFIRPHGVPILMTDTNEAWCYHLSAKTWVQIYDPRYSSKEKMKSTTEEHGGVGGDGGGDTRRILNMIEKIARDRGGNYGTLSYLAQGESKLGHLYNQLLSAELVSSPNEYKEILLSYAKALADVGNGEKINILCSRLLGPFGVW